MMNFISVSFSAGQLYHGSIGYLLQPIEVESLKIYSGRLNRGYHANSISTPILDKAGRSTGQLIYVGGGWQMPL